MEEELLSGFSSIPTPGGPLAKRVAERMAAGGVAQERQSASLTARVSAQATSKSKAPAPEQVSMVKLWEKLTKLSPKDRTTAISNLDAGLREKLSKYLATRKNGRGHEQPASSAAARPSPSPSPETSKKLEEQGSDSSGESSSSDSSGSSGSSHEKNLKGSGRRGGVIGQKPARRVMGKSPVEGEVG